MTEVYPLINGVSRQIKMADKPPSDRDCENDSIFFLETGNHRGFILRS
jgi:hypothetical protein